MKKLIALLSICCFVSLTTKAHSDLDISPDGKTAALFGKYNQVLYVVDIEKSEVKSRMRLDAQSMGSSNVNMGFSQDGSKLWCSIYNHLYCYETGTWTEALHIEKAYNVEVSGDKSKVMYRTNSSDSFVVKDMNSLADYSKFEIKESRKVEMMSISSVDNSVMLIYRSEKDESEPSSIEKDKLKALEGTKKATAWQKNDGEKSRMVKLNLLTGEIVHDEYSWFSDTGRGELFSFGGDYFMLGYKGSFKFTAKNQLEVLELKSQVSMDFKIPHSDVVAIGFYNAKGFYDLSKGKFTEVEYPRTLEENQTIFLNDKFYCFNNFEFRLFNSKGEEISLMKVM